MSFVSSHAHISHISLLLFILPDTEGRAGPSPLRLDTSLSVRTSTPSPHRHPKFFKEPRGHHHFDVRFFTGEDNLTKASIHARLHSIAAVWASWARNHHVQWWLVYGSLLGAWRTGDIIPWDNDLDFGMLRRDLLHLPARVQLDNITFFERNPYAYETSTQDHSNVVDARIVCTHTGLFADFFAYHQTADDSTFYMNKSGDAVMDETDIFPLTRIRFGSLHLPAPAETVSLLNKWYSSLDPPSDALDGIKAERDEEDDGQGNVVQME